MFVLKFHVSAICAIILLISTSHCMSQTSLEKVIEEGISQSISTLAKETDVERIAILPLTGDDTKDVTERLITAVVGSKLYSVIDRENLEILLKEANFQMSDMINPDTAVQAGKIAGVDAVMYGYVKRMQSGESWVDVSFHIQMVKVKTGEIFWSDDVDKSIGSPPKDPPEMDSLMMYLLGTLILLIIFFVLIIWLRSRRKNIVSITPGIDIVRKDGTREHEPKIKVTRKEESATENDNETSRKVYPSNDVKIKRDDS